MKAKEFAMLLPEKCQVRIRQDGDRTWLKMNAVDLVKSLEGDWTVKWWRNELGGGYRIVTEPEIFKH